MRREGPCQRAARNRLHHRRLDLEEPARHQEAANRRDHAAAHLEDPARVGIHGQVQIALPVADLDVRQPVPLLWQRQEALGEERQARGPDRQLLRLRAEDPAGHADPVAEVQQPEGLEVQCGDRILADVDLHARLAVGQDQEVRLPEGAHGQDAPGHRDVYVRRVERLTRCRAVAFDDLGDGRVRREAVAVDGHTEADELRRSSRAAGGPGRTRAVRSRALQFPADGVEHAVDEGHRVVGAEAARQLEGLVDDHAGRRLLLVEELVNRQAEDEAIDDVHPLDPPGGRSLRNERIDRRDALGGALGEPFGERLECVGQRRFGFSRARTAHVRHVHAPDLPLIQHLERHLACPVARGPRRGAVGPRVGGRRHDAASVSSARNSDAISTAARATSAPLLASPGRARSRACSSVSVVSTPKATGTPESSATRERPCDTASAMYSKCMVSPLMRQPRHTTASKRPDSARRWAVTGSSKAPGHAHDGTGVRGHAAASSADSAPASSPSVTSALNRETTTANRLAPAWGAPWRSKGIVLFERGQRGRCRGSLGSRDGAETNYTPQPAGGRAQDRAGGVGPEVRESAVRPGTND